LGRGAKSLEKPKSSPRLPQFTVCVSGAEELPIKLVLPLYVAVMVCVPAVSFEVVYFAVEMPDSYGLSRAASRLYGGVIAVLRSPVHSMSPTLHRCGGSHRHF